MVWHGGCGRQIIRAGRVAAPAPQNIRETAMDRRLTAEDIDWLRKLRNARAANQPSPDIPTSVVRRRSEEHTSELQSRLHLVCRLLLEKKKKKSNIERT